MKSIKRAFVLVTSICILLSGGICRALPFEEPIAQSPIGYDLSDMVTTDIYDNTVTGEIFHEYKYTFILVWVSWFSSCMYSLETMQSLKAEYREIGINTISIYYEDEQHATSAARRALEERGLDILALRYVNSESLLELFSITDAYIPVIFIVDGEGKVVEQTTCSYLTEYEMRYMLDAYRDDVHKVEFKDTVDDSLIFKTYIKHGKDAIYPDIPQHDNYIFYAWDRSSENIVEDTEICALYCEYGDVNWDGYVNTGDATLILRANLGLQSLTEFQKAVADMNGDGMVNSGDAVSVLQKIVGLS